MTKPTIQERAEAKELINVPIEFVFKGQQLMLWNLLDFRPRPTWIFAEIMEQRSGNISKQLQQMAQRTGLVKFEIDGNLKNWYKVAGLYATEQQSISEARVKELEEALKILYTAYNSDETEDFYNLDIDAIVNQALNK